MKVQEISNEISRWYLGRDQGKEELRILEQTPEDLKKGEVRFEYSNPIRIVIVRHGWNRVDFNVCLGSLVLEHHTGLLMEGLPEQFDGVEVEL